MKQYNQNNLLKANLFLNEMPSIDSYGLLDMFRSFFDIVDMVSFRGDIHSYAFYCNEDAREKAEPAMNIIISKNLKENNGVKPIVVREWKPSPLPFEVKQRFFMELLEQIKQFFGCRVIAYQV